MALQELERPAANQSQFVFFLTDGADDPPKGGKFKKGMWDQNWEGLTRKARELTKKRLFKAYGIGLKKGTDVELLRKVFGDEHTSILTLSGKDLIGYFKRQKELIRREKLKAAIAQEIKDGGLQIGHAGKDNAALITLELASPEPIPLPVVDVLGSLITQPAGGSQLPRERGLQNYLAGGYEVVQDQSGGEAIAAFTRLDLTLSLHPLVPLGAQRLPYLFDLTEAPAVFRLPPSTTDSPPGLDFQSWRTQSAPRELPQDGCLLGVNVHRGTRPSVRISSDDRRRHVYLVGQTGTGKTTLLKTMILDEMASGGGLCVIDPHGDLFRELLGLVPEQRLDDVVVFDPPT